MMRVNMVPTFCIKSKVFIDLVRATLLQKCYACSAHITFLSNIFLYYIQFVIFHYLR